MGTAVDPRPRIDRRWYHVPNPVDGPGWITDGPGEPCASNVVLDVVGLTADEVQELLDEHNRGR